MNKPDPARRVELINHSAEKLTRGSFRLVLPDVEGMVRPIATVGVDSEGGVFLTPAEIQGGQWRYGHVQPGASPIKEALTPSRPKLIWHRSGEIHVSLSGTQLEPVRRQWHVPGTLDGQRMCVVASQPLRTTHPQPMRTRDAILLQRPPGQSQEPPALVGISFAITPPSPKDRYPKGIGPVGLVEGVGAQMVLSLAHYGLPLTLRGSVLWETNPAIVPPAGHCVGAHETHSEALAIWSASMPNPVLLP